MNAHTPGPWAAHNGFPLEIVPADHADRPCGGAQDDAFDLAHYAQEVCSLSLSRRHKTDAEVAANAALIARAPDLLADNARLTALNVELVAALAEVCAILDAWTDDGDDLPAFQDPCGLAADIEECKLHARITAVLAKVQP